MSVRISFIIPTVTCKCLALFLAFVLRFYLGYLRSKSYSREKRKPKERAVKPHGTRCHYTRSTVNTGRTAFSRTQIYLLILRTLFTRATRKKKGWRMFLPHSPTLHHSCLSFHLDLISHLRAGLYLSLSCAGSKYSTRACKERQIYFGWC